MSMASHFEKELVVVDSHTAGEPTRVIVEGGPELGGGPMEEKRRVLCERHDWVRSAAVNEPRGSDAVVGAILTVPHRADCDVGVIFFNNAGYINMCVHGTIGLAVTLGHLGRRPRKDAWRIDTPVGMVEARVGEGHRVTVENVPSYRHRADLALDVPGYGPIRGDVAWGGNWFFLVQEHGLEVSFDQIGRLTDFSLAVRRLLSGQGITGVDGAEIDHIEVFAPPGDLAADSRNFVLCPGGAYDRSPCGTGTSAKMACLYDAGLLAEGAVWRQAGILGTVFEGRVRVRDARIVPSITGTAHITGEARLLLDRNDPFEHGITPDAVS